MWKLVIKNSLPELSQAYKCKKRTSDHGHVCIRPVLSLAESDDGSVFYGDEGSNLKLFNWKTGFHFLNVKYLEYRQNKCIIITRLCEEVAKSSTRIRFDKYDLL